MTTQPGIKDATGSLYSLSMGFGGSGLATGPRAGPAMMSCGMGLPQSEMRALQGARVLAAAVAAGRPTACHGSLALASIATSTDPRGHRWGSWVLGAAGAAALGVGWSLSPAQARTPAQAAASSSKEGSKEPTYTKEEVAKHRDAKSRIWVGPLLQYVRMDSNHESSSHTADGCGGELHRLLLFRWVCLSTRALSWSPVCTSAALVKRAHLHHRLQDVFSCSVH